MVSFRVDSHADDHIVLLICSVDIEFVFFYESNIRLEVDK